MQGTRNVLISRIPTETFNMGGLISNHKHYSFVTTSVTATAPPISSVPGYNLSSHNDSCSRMKGTSGAVYLPGFECLVNLDYCCIHTKFQPCNILDMFGIIVTNRQGEKVLSVIKPRIFEQNDEDTEKRMQCNDIFDRPLFALHRYRDNSGLNLAPSEDECLGYIESKKSGLRPSTFAILNHKGEAIIKASSDWPEKVTTITRHITQADGQLRETKVGKVTTEGKELVIKFSKDLDIGLKACIIAKAIDTLL